MAENKKTRDRKNPFAWLAAVVKTTWEDLRKVLGYLAKPKAWKAILHRFRIFLKHFFQHFGAERIGREAGSLTYITILGFVPFVMFLVMLAPELPFLNLKEKIFVTISNNLMPTSALAVNDLIDDMLARRTGFNVFSFIILLISSYSLFRVIRNTFDRILKIKVEVKPDLFSQLVKFLGTIILGVLIMVILFSSTSLPLVSRLLKLPYLQWMVWGFPFLTQFVGLFFLYMLMPSIPIRRASLIRGAFWTTVIWVLVKSGFDFYIVRLTNFQAMYGVLAALPILLLWIYVNWIIILGGIVMVATIEDRRIPGMEGRPREHMVRLTMEIFGGSKLNKRLERFIRREELGELSSVLHEDKEE